MPASQDVGQALRPKTALLPFAGAGALSAELLGAPRGQVGGHTIDIFRRLRHPIAPDRRRMGPNFGPERADTRRNQPTQERTTLPLKPLRTVIF